ncbi:type II toxin-antitoxin system tRNA(fMet)-specific endonuclease VapC [Methylotetracoccus oryzae]|uniref:type II toxin-antitoxin system tRNA(fMet)-specific endonuclease VapC n=1 Tax=Methylotetracoccus oryzae TaxID=1919059 RepID=UPI0011186820|nr:type II toxin-antitoxin system VapC family toxin [Methylotetracoccus oryzae]
MIHYMLDTNACIGVINGSPPTLRNRLLGMPPETVTISQIVRYELEFGVCNSRQQQRNRANLAHFLKYVQVLDWSDEQSIEAAEIRCALARKGQPIGHYDILIAAHARSLAAVLVTHNTHEFGRVEGLQLEDWELP